MIDISSIKGESFGGSKYWLLILDDCTGQCWSKFLTAKSHTANVLVPFIKELKTRHDKTVKYIRCDNAGENKATDTAWAKEGLGIQFEYMAPGTLQQNGRVERKFATLYGRNRSMMNQANLPLTIRKQVWTEVAATATNIDTFLVTNNKPVASYNEFHEK
jgi:transposase InsO family protein